MKNMPGMRIFCLIAVMLINLSVRADITRDSLRIDPSAPFDNEDIRVRSYITIPNCCLPIDSATIKKNMAEYYWLQTKCADPWHTGEMHSDEETCDSLRAYLAGYGISLGYASIRYDASLAEDCEACMCKTGNIICTYIHAEDSVALGQLGFQRSTGKLYDLVIAYHTEQDPACDCYCQCLDTVEIGMLMAGEHNLIFASRFIHPEVPGQCYGINDTLNFTVNASGMILIDRKESGSGIYPNPGTGSFRISERYIGCRLQLADLQGKIIRDEILSNSSVSLESIQPGLYVVRFFRNNILLGTEKMVVH